MARRLNVPSKELKPIIISSIGSYNAARIQRFEIPVNFPTTDIDELGSNLHAGTVTDIAEISATIQAMDVSAKLFAALTSTAYASFTNADISAIDEVDLVGEIKDTATTDIAKSVHARRMRCTGLTFTYTVDGEATEEYTFQGSEKRWLKYDVQVDTFTGGGAGPLTLSQSPIQLKNNNKLLSLIVDGEYWTEVASGASTKEFSVTGTTVTLGSSYTSDAAAVYHYNKINNWTYISDSSIPAAIRGKDIPVKINTNKIDRVQSVTIRGTFPNTAIKEMGNRSVVGYQTGIPAVEGDISVMDTDTELIALFSTGALNPADTEFTACELTSSGVTLEVILYNPSSDCNQPIGSGTVMKTVWIPSITITSEGHATNVGGQAMQTFGFRGATGALSIYKGSK